jgi:hypothetical protein
MWQRLSIASAVVLAVMSTISALFPPVGVERIYWLLGFYCVIGLGFWISWKAIRDAEKEADERHSVLVTAADGGDNFPYIEAVEEAGSERPLYKIALLRGHGNTPLYDVAFSLRREGGAEVLESGEVATLKGGGHRQMRAPLMEGRDTVHMTARNGEFSETIDIVRSGETLTATMTVARGINPRNLPHGVVLTKTTH